MVASRVESAELKGAQLHRDSPPGPTVSNVVQHPTTFVRTVPKSAAQPFLDDNTHTGWLDVLGLNA